MDMVKLVCVCVCVCACLTCSCMCTFAVNDVTFTVSFNPLNACNEYIGFS